MPKEVMLPARRDDGREIVPLKRIDAMVSGIVDELTKAKGAGKFFDMVPAEYQPWIRRLVGDAYPTKGAGKTVEEFTEAMSLGWLARRRVFEEIGRESGLERVDSISAKAQTPIFALTMSASIIAASIPRPSGERNIYYMRLREREDASIPPAQPSWITGSVEVGSPCHTYFESSPVIGVLANPKAPINVEDTCGTFSQSFVVVGHYTMTGGQKVDVLERRKPK